MTQTLDNAHETVLKLYGNRLRLRVCGLLRDGDRLLMVRHRGINPSDTFWCPPGGGSQFNETAPEALVREFQEETGLTVSVGPLLFVNEFLKPPLHAMELFFVVDRLSGQLRQGTDPEMSVDGQIIDDVRLMTFAAIKALPPDEVHHLFSRCQTLEAVYRLQGYLV